MNVYRNVFRTWLSAGALSILLGACGGGSEDASSAGGGNDMGGATGASRFSQSVQWTVEVPAQGEAVCFDFDTGTQNADCTGASWDLMLATPAGGRGGVPSLFTNSGVSGSGRGGAYLGPFDHTWEQLQAFVDATHDPEMGGAELPAQVYSADRMDSAFAGDNMIGSAIFEYALGGEDHYLYPNMRTVLIEADGTVYALQVTGYYGGADGTTSGHPAFRWIDRTHGAAVREAQVDASRGTAYFNLQTGQQVADASGNWHIAFYRYNVQLNGGDSGTGGVRGAAGPVPDGLYDGDGQPVNDAFRDANLGAYALALLSSAPVPAADARDWKTDAKSSVLNPAWRRAQGDFDFGWYRYSMQNHMLTATPENGSLVRGGEGNSYARVHLTEIRYADPSDANSRQTWTLAMDVQPAQ